MHIIKRLNGITSNLHNLILIRSEQKTKKKGGIDPPGMRQHPMKEYKHYYPIACQTHTKKNSEINKMCNQIL